MAVTSPPGKTEAEHDRDLAQRVADLEALIEEARRRARRRRIRNGAALAVLAGATVAGLIGFHGGGGSGAGAAALGGEAGAKGQATKPTPSLARLPYGNEAMAFAFDPRRPNIVYVASPDARGGTYIFKTTDNGRHWRTTAARGAGGMSDILTLTADPQHPGTLYAGTDTSVYKTVNGGRTWRPFGHGLFPTNPGQRVCRFGSCFHRYIGTPGLTDWNRNNGWVLDVAVDPRDSNVVYSAAGAVRKSIDGGRTWKTVFVPRQLNTHRAIPLDFNVTRIAIAPTHPESIYAIAHYNPDGETAIYKSTNSGTTWQVTGGGSNLPPSCCGDSQDALSVDPGNPQTLYAAVGDNVFATTDGGASWQPAANGLPANDVTSLAVDPERPGTVYVSVEQNLNRAHPMNGVTKTTGAIYKTRDGGQTWTEVFSGSGVDKVAVDPERPATVYAAGWAGGRYQSHASRCGQHPACYWHYQLLRSLDGGHAWTIAR